MVTPAHAASGEFRTTSDGLVYCPSVGSPRWVQWSFISEVDAEGRLESIEVTPASAATSATSVAGEPIKLTWDVRAQLVIPAGPTSASLRFKVVWDLPDGPKEFNYFKTVQLPECVLRPVAKFTSLCNGRVNVQVTNPNDAPPRPKITLEGAYGWTTSSAYLHSGQSQSWEVPADAASSIKVTMANEDGTEPRPLATYAWKPCGGTTTQPPGARKPAPAAPPAAPLVSATPSASPTPTPSDETSPSPSPSPSQAAPAAAPSTTDPTARILGWSAGAGIVLGAAAAAVVVLIRRRPLSTPVEETVS
ncbi:hypothetical protein [Rhizocola hellebori]|uniref:hypothetical protein n=1 Tax=Rhizocola hellebori TaxID=1392758 RepID=UPI001943B4AA|nr:hypothetical protein [Rhizocola hellebori]